MTYRDHMDDGAVVLEDGANLPEGMKITVTPLAHFQEDMPNDQLGPSLYKRLKPAIGMAKGYFPGRRRINYYPCLRIALFRRVEPYRFVLGPKLASNNTAKRVAKKDNHPRLENLRADLGVGIHVDLRKSLCQNPLRHLRRVCSRRANTQI